MSEIQKVYTKNFGIVEVVRSWQDNGYHIALCSNGAYVHITGLPVKDKAELRKALPVSDLQAALDWFDHRHEVEENPPMRILVEGDGSCVFEDGSPITSISQLTQALKPGPMLDAALLWFTKQRMSQDERQAAARKAGPAKKIAKPPVKSAAKKATGGRPKVAPPTSAAPGSPVSTMEVTA